jgi:hypothetical protein
MLSAGAVSTLNQVGRGADIGSAMMSDFTPRGQQVLALARQEAEWFNHNYVGTEHLLLGLIKLGQGVALNVLQRMGLDLEGVRLEVEKHVGPHPETKMVGNIPYTPRVKKVLVLGFWCKFVKYMYLSGERPCRFKRPGPRSKFLGAVVACPVSGLRLNCCFLIFSANSMPRIVTAAVSNRLNPSIGRIRCFIRR